MKLHVMKWISRPDRNGDGLLLAELCGEYEIPIALETHNVTEEKVKPGEDQEFELIIEDTGSISVYAGADDYAERSGSNMAEESLIPSGLFPPQNETDFEENSTAIITGKVVKVYDNPVAFGFTEDAVLFTITCLCAEFNAVSYSEVAEVRNIKAGNIVSGMYWLQGWPAQSDN